VSRVGVAGRGRFAEPIVTVSGDGGWLVAGRGLAAACGQSARPGQL